MQSKKVIYVGDVPTITDLAEIFKTKLNFNSSLIIGENIDYLRHRNKLENFINLETIEKYEFDMDYENIPPLGMDMLEKLSDYEPTSLSLLDDTTGWNFSFTERKNFYYDTIKFWISIMEKNKPNLIVMVNEPRKFSTFIFKNLCERIFNIPIIFFEKVSFFKEQITCIKLENFEKDEKKKLADEIKNILHSPNLFSKKNNYIQNLFLKKNKSPYFLGESKLDVKEVKFFFNQNSIFFKKNLNFYEKNCDNVSFRDNYILFHETFYETKKTIINKGIFENTFTILKNISKTLPKNFKIYFYEKFENFSSKNVNDIHYGRSLFKNKNYFLKLKKIKNLKLISNTTNLDEILKKSKAVCSISDKTVISSYFSNKPTIILGECSFSFLENISPLKDYENLKLILNNLENNKFEKIKNPTLNDIKRINSYVTDSVNLKNLNG